MVNYQTVLLAGATGNMGSKIAAALANKNEVNYTFIMCGAFMEVFFAPFFGAFDEERSVSFLCHERFAVRWRLTSYSTPLTLPCTHISRSISKCCILPP